MIAAWIIPPIAALLTLGLGTAHAACPIPPDSADGALSSDALTGGGLVLELRIDRGATADSITALLAPLSARKLPATLLVAPEVAEALGPTLRQAAKAGHEIGLLLPRAEQGPLLIGGAEAYAQWWEELRAAKKLVQKAAHAPVRVVALRPSQREAELAADQQGFRTILPLEDRARSPVRRSAATAGQPGRARVLSPGPYPEGCGAQLPAWTPGSLDRATRYGTAGAPGRVALPLDGADPALLARWLDEVLAPAQVRLLKASEVGRVRIAAPPPAPPPAARDLDVATLKVAVAALPGRSRLPRTLPGGLNLTEAYAALLSAVANPGAERLPLPDLAPPSDFGRSSLPAEGRPVPAAAIRTAAEALLQAQPKAIPALSEVDGLALTAGEFLSLMAQVLLELPPVARPAEPPDPFGEGGGWGQSKAGAR